MKERLTFLFCARLTIMLLGACSSPEGPRSIPEFSMVLPDTTKVFNSKDIPEGKPIMIVWFNPGCKDCQKETEHLLAEMESFKDVNIYMVTSHTHDQMMTFYKHLRLDTCSNMVVGIDKTITIPKEYKTNVIPLTMVYDARKKLKAGFKGVPDFKQLKETIQQSKI